MEKLVCSRVDDYLERNDLHDTHQTAYKKFNSTETALTSIQDSILKSMDAGKITVLVLLDLSAAYDTVDHDIFLNRLSNYFKFSGKALQWFESYIRGRMVHVKVGDEISDATELECGVAQSAVLGGKCYNMYTVPLKDVKKSQGY